MKLPKQKKKNNEVHRYLFWHILVILFGLLVVFLVVSHVNRIFTGVRGFFKAESIDTLSKVEMQSIRERYKNQRHKADVSKAGINTYIWGYKDEIEDIIKFQLDNMGEEYKLITDLEQCQNAKVLFVLKDDFNASELALLMKMNSQGTDLVFCDILFDQSKEYMEMIGVEEYMPMEELKGIRLSARILFGTITELDKKMFLPDINLENGVEVYAHGIPGKEKVKEEVTELTPLFWRYYQRNHDANVYVVDDALMKSPVGYSIVAFLYTQMQEDYLYPTMKSRCFIVSGMPYTQNYRSDYLEKEYNRDAIGTETDVFFPQLKRMEEKYNLNISWCTADYKKLDRIEQLILKHQIKSIKESNGELLEMRANKIGFADIPIRNRFIPWSQEFQWSGAEYGSILQMPYMEIDTAKSSNYNVYCASMAKAFGLYAYHVDIKQFLEETNNNMDWVDWSLRTEEILGSQMEKMPWMQNKTVSDALMDLAKFESSNPIVEYSEEGIDIKIPNFISEECFYLSTRKDFSVSDGVQVIELSDEFYLLELDTSDAKVIWK